MIASETPSGGPQTSNPRCWVLIESGSNQDYIFSSNRRAYAVGASHLLKQIPNWVEAAVKRRGNRVDPVVITSSKAMLLVDDPNDGLTIVRYVTERAVTEAPGLDIWGYVEPLPDAVGDPMGRLTTVLAAHAEQRWRRAQPVARAPMTPFLMGCGFTGRPAAQLWKRGDTKVPASAQAVAILGQASSARREMTALLPNHEEAIASTDDGEELVNAGWVAVIHVDGNEIGQKIVGITDIEILRSFSQDLEDATLGALREAVSQVSKGAIAEPKEDSSAQTADGAGAGTVEGWLLPLIVGGDDITVACDARYAVQFTRAYLTEFERLTAQSDVITGVAGSHLTASAGIAVVKPHFPFGSAYALAEELAGSTKRALKANANAAAHRSGYDFHVLRDSVIRSLSDMRIGEVAHGLGNISLDTGPWLAPPQTRPPEESEWVVAHDDQQLIDQVVAMVSDAEKDLSQSERRRLRDALQAGGTAMDALKERFAAHSVGHADNPFLLDNKDDPTLSYWPAVLDLADIATGTAVRSES